MVSGKTCMHPRPPAICSGGHCTPLHYINGHRSLRRPRHPVEESLLLESILISEAFGGTQVIFFRIPTQSFSNLLSNPAFVANPY